MPQDPLDYDSEWRCDQQGCAFRLTSSQVEAIEEEASRLIEKGPVPREKPLVDFYEHLLDELSSRFHPHHYLLMKVKSNLISQYGNVPRWSYAELPYQLVSRLAVAE